MINPNIGVIKRAGSFKMIKKARDAILLFSAVDSLVIMMASSNNKIVGRFYMFTSAISG